MRISTSWSLLPHVLVAVIAAPAPAPAPASGNTTQSTCSQLASALPNSVFFPDAPTYNASISSYPFLQLRLHPTCIVRPTSAQDVSTALNVLKKNNGTRFAVRGGGHNANVGFNNIDNGVTIDMQSLNAVEVERGDQVIRIGAGSLWQNVYDTAEIRNLTALGGRIGVVGVAGFLTGGGVAFYSPWAGWSCDAVQNFQIVLSSGDLVNANASSRADLYQALKGGQSNFGIVTRFDVKAYPARRIYGGRIVYAPAAENDVLSAYTNFKMDKGQDTGVAGWMTMQYNSSSGAFNPVAIMWQTNPSKGMGGLKAMLDVRPQVMNGMVEAPISEHTRNASRQVTGAPKRTVWATTSFHISPTIMRKVTDLWKSYIPSICTAHPSANAIAQLTFQAVPPAPSAGSAQNSFGFTSTETPGKDLLFLQVVMTYDTADADRDFEWALKNLIEAVDELTKKEGVYHPWTYMNFASWWQDPLGSYAGDEKEGLKSVASKYDAEGLWQKQLSGGFKLY